MELDHGMTRRQFVSTTATALAGAVLVPNPASSGIPRTTLSESAGREARVLSLEKSAWKVKPFPTSQVRLRRVYSWTAWKPIVAI